MHLQQKAEHERESRAWRRHGRLRNPWSAAVEPRCAIDSRGPGECFDHVVDEIDGVLRAMDTAAAPADELLAHDARCTLADALRSVLEANASLQRLHARLLGFRAEPRAAYRL